MIGKKLTQKILRPLFAGVFTQDETKGMRLIIGEEGDPLTGPAVKLYLLIDESDGVIADVAFQAYGSPALIGAADTACELILRKNHAGAARISADLIDQHVRDKKNIPAFSEEMNSDLNLVISALDDATRKCSDLPSQTSYESTPIAFDFPNEGVYPGFEELEKEQKIAVIEEIVEKEIRPYVELDAGGVDIHDLVKDEVFISYSGSCTSCYAATGSTLSAIQNILRARVHPELTVTPILS